MAFERLQNLGTEKFTKIINALLRGQSAMALAREIQMEWRDFGNIPEKTLTQQLNRLRLAAAEGMFGEKIAKQIQKGAVPQIKLLEKVSPSVLERMEELAGIQHQRVMMLVQKEKLMALPTGAMLQATNAVFNDYSKLLQDLQKMRFDLGLDEYRGVIPGMRGATASITLPDGTSIQKQVFEAVTTVEAIFERRKIPSNVNGNGDHG